MNPKYAEKYTELLYLGVPQNKRREIRGMENTRYVNPTHIYLAQVTVPPKDFENYQVPNYQMFIGDTDRISIKLPDLSKYDSYSGHFSVPYLKKIFDNIVSDDVKITLSEDCPITLEWKTDDDDWKVLLAPRIVDE